jgi:uncharacterized protein involved in exopolysaccharide biosynthesis
VTLGGTLLALAVVFLLPSWYRSESVMLPAPESPMNKGASLLKGGSSLDSLLGGLGGGGLDSQTLAKVVESRTVADAVIDKFALRALYGFSTLERTRKKFREHLDVKVDRKSGAVTVTFEDKDPERARAVTATMVDLSSTLYRKLQSGRAGEERRFLEKRLATAVQGLNDAHQQLRKFQEESKIVDPEEQMKATVETLTGLRSQLAAKESELGYVRSYAGPNDVDVTRVTRELDQLRRQVARVELGTKRDTLPSVASLPKLAADYAQYLREVKVQEKIFEFVTQQYEIAKASEARDVASVLILDPPIRSDRPFWPRRGTVTAICGVLLLALSILFVFLRESFQRGAAELDGPRAQDRL